jgi:hypothetical protein
MVRGLVIILVRYLAASPLLSLVIPAKAGVLHEGMAGIARERSTDRSKALKPVFAGRTL